MTSRVGSLGVDELLSQPVVLSPTEEVHRAIALLRRTRNYETFIVEHDKVKGLLTTRDVLRAKSVAGSRISSLPTRIPHL